MRFSKGETEVGNSYPAKFYQPDKLTSKISKPVDVVEKSEDLPNEGIPFCALVKRSFCTIFLKMVVEVTSTSN